MRLIDADALEDVLVNHGFCYCNESDYSDGVASGFLLARDDVKNAPTIDAEPIRHGRWEHGREISRSYIGDACIGVQYEDWKCSNCGIVCEQSDKPKYKYCPVCGARMDGGGK